MNSEVSVQEEIEQLSMGKPHVLLLGAGASKAALPNGDKYGRPIPILRELAQDLDLYREFPGDLQELSRTDFEAAYSQLFKRGEGQGVEQISQRLSAYFSELQLPDEANLYDVMLLCLRKKDVIATFNWDPFLMQSRQRLRSLGVSELPHILFLHGNVAVGYCADHKRKGPPGFMCDKCGKELIPSKLLYPIENKNYQDGDLIETEWQGVRLALENCFMFSIFGYSAPRTDIEAVDLLKQAWGEVDVRQFEQTEIIGRPGCDHNRLHDTWQPFIHTHHYDIFESFYESWMAEHPRRTGEAYWNQYIAAQFISENPVPSDIRQLEELVEWYRPLLEVERVHNQNPSSKKLAR
jgi:hypothetical protein